MSRIASLAVALTALSLPATAEAYVGPGAGLSLLGALWGLVAAIVTALLFVLAWPLRRMLRRRRGAGEAVQREGTSPEAAGRTGRSLPDRDLGA